MQTMSDRYRRYVLATMTLVYTFNFLDRGLMILLLEPIKQDLHLSDTQLGFVTGIAFALFYAVLGLPMARWADRGNRVTITALALALWGCTVMLCLWVTNYVQLVIARVGAAVGEAGCTPPTYSLVGDYFPGAAERARSMAIWWLASPISLLISFIAGGWLSSRYGWRLTFFAAGIPALIVSALVKRTILEPRCRSAHRHLDPPPSLSVTGVLSALWHQSSSRHLGIAYILLLTMTYGMAPWYAAFMTRSHAMSTADLGVWLGFIFGFGGIAGILAGGLMAGSRFARDERSQMRISAAAVLLLVPFFMLFLLLPGKFEALLALIPSMVVLGVFVGPTFALMQRLVPDEMRATTLAVVMLFSNLIGMGVGPQLVGLVSDALLPIVGKESLRYAMLSISLIVPWAAYHFWKVGATVVGDLSAIGSIKTEDHNAIAAI